MAERKKRFSGLYWQQFALTAGMVMLTLLLLGVSFFALSYNYNFTERRDELQERASLIAQVSVDYLKSGGQTEDENLKRFISLGSAMTNAEFLVCNDSGYALLTADQRLGGKVVAIPQEITQEVLTGSGLYQGRSSLGGAYTSKQFVVGVPVQDGDQTIGVVLAVDSKNDEANALAGLNHPDSVLHPDDFVCIKANWDPKDQNLKAIAAELSLGADSFVFADDNPAERAIVAAQLPGVATPVLDGAENYIKMLDHGGYFETTILSGDDLKKTAQYHARAQAAQAQAAFADYGQYLDSLEMTATIRPFEAVYMQRIAQLTNKSNQFNLTTLRCTEDDIRSMAEKPDWITLYGKLVDKFADNGVVTVVAGQAQGQTLCLRLWLMSCRVLKRGMEDAMMDTLAAKAAAAGYTALEGYYYPTAKNAMVREFYAGYGVEKTAEDADGNTTWRLDLAAYNPRCPHIKIET